MRRSSVFLSLCFALVMLMPCTKAFSQLPVSQLLLSMPDSLCPYLDMKQRIVMVEYANKQISDSVENIYGGHSHIAQLTDSYLNMQVADGFTIEILTDSTGFYLIQTACAPICSSIIKRYIANWLYVEEIKPQEKAMFMKAEVQNGDIVWSDQTPLLLDEEEKKNY